MPWVGKSMDRRRSLRLAGEAARSERHVKPSPKKRKPRLSLAQWVLMQDLRGGPLTIGSSQLATARVLGKLGLVYELEAFVSGGRWRVKVALTADGKVTAHSGHLPDRLTNPSASEVR